MLELKLPIAIVFLLLYISGQTAKTPLAEDGGGRRRMWLSDEMLVMPSNRRLYLLVALPVHQPYTAAKCGELNLQRGLLPLTALVDAVRRVNARRDILPGIQLGVVAVDSCATDLRAVSNIYELLSATNLSADDVVGAVVMHDDRMSNLMRLLTQLRITKFFLDPVPFSQLHSASNLAVGVRDSQASVVHSIRDLIQAFGWNYVSIVYEDDSKYGPLFAKIVQAENICFASKIRVDQYNGDNVTTMQLAVRQLLLTEARGVIVIMSDVMMVQFLEALAVENVRQDRFILLSASCDWRNNEEANRALLRSKQPLVNIEPSAAPSVHQWTSLKNLSVFNHAPYPSSWFKEAVEVTNKCHFNDTIRPDNRASFSAICNETAKIDSAMLKFDGDLSAVAIVAESIAVALRNIIISYCPGVMVTQMSDCLTEHRRKLVDTMRDANFTVETSSNDQASLNVHFNGEAIREVAFTISYYRVGNWTDVGTWTIDEGVTLMKQILVRDTDGLMHMPKSQCTPEENCQCPELIKSQLQQRTLFFRGMNSLQSVVIAGLCGLGVAACALCQYKICRSNTLDCVSLICATMLLFGLAAVYVHAGFILSVPSTFSCGLVRLLAGISWALVMAPIIVKIGCCLYPKPYVQPLQLCVAVVCLQTVISVEWVLLDSPFDQTTTQAVSPAAWRCASNGHRHHSAIAVSFSPLWVLAAVGALLAGVKLNRTDADHRWLFACCSLFLLAWTTTTWATTVIDYGQSDYLLFSVSVLLASFFLAALFFRPIFLHQTKRITRQQPALSWSAEQSECTLVIDERMLGQADKGQTIFTVPTMVPGKTAVIYSGGCQFNPTRPQICDVSSTKRSTSFKALKN